MVKPPVNRNLNPNLYSVGLTKYFVSTKIWRSRRDDKLGTCQARNVGFTNVIKKAIVVPDIEKWSLCWVVKEVVSIKGQRRSWNEKAQVQENVGFHLGCMMHQNYR